MIPLFHEFGFNIYNNVSMKKEGSKLTHTIREHFKESFSGIWRIEKILVVEEYFSKPFIDYSQGTPTTNAFNS